MIRDIADLMHIFFEGRFRDLKKNRLFKIALFGFLSFVVEAVFFEFFGIRWHLWRPSTAALIGAELAIVFNFIMQNTFTFTDQKILFKSAMIRKFLQFNFLVSISLGLQWLSVRVGEHLAYGVHYYLILRLFNVAGVLLGFIFNYQSYTKVIWKNTETGATGGKNLSGKPEVL